MGRGFWFELLVALYYTNDPSSSSSSNSSLTPDSPSQLFPNATYPGAIDPSALGGSQFLESSPPFYPSPWANGQGDWADAYSKAKDFVSQLTLLEKINLTTGVG